MGQDHEAEMADRIAEERSENEGMAEHRSKTRNPVRWEFERGRRVAQSAAPRQHLARNESSVPKSPRRPL
jgi:hypothetical protein